MLHIFYSPGHSAILRNQGFLHVPQHKMDKNQFLEAICQKAGLPSDFWKEKQLNIQLFTATVFSEKEMEV